MSDMWLPVFISLVAVFITVKYMLSRLRLKQKNSELYVLITGCDSGFGYLAAKMFASRGIHVFAGCLKEFQSDTGPSELLIPILLDVTNEEQIKNTVKTVSDRLPPNHGLWAVINNAGVALHTGLCEAQTPDNFKDCLNVNFFGMVMVVKHFLPLLRKSSGRIINMASIAGRFAFPMSSPYVVSKFAVEGYSECLRRELYHQDVSVHVIEPGIFDTGILDRAQPVEFSKSTFDSLSEEAKDYYGRDFIQKSWEKMGLIKGSKDLSQVTETYYHAVTARYPQAYYRVGWDAQTLFTVLIHLPVCVSDFLITWRQAKLAGVH
ncbi:dehydrogenase/reductase SDR family member 9-like isoform X2 [Ostrea edulis]|uniref:dehydrogenase/reductase SDR family member 9-like isoform X2 n=1 Tax=Ostrea edulis TaxID=37623 RepID=UPI0024AFCC13|nr:dehydrogenase/reductase SDR family member 9-like isoform X2 [Ostrea edulis]XP_048755094.2 dehydrogenase/reductase SDR family member 9-like isoform X2 [Ostrea edulis]XP_056007273.1 dehydrogenase/reductase SDR family member 9-like isoform X2 [Ostrea edulis]